MQVKKTFLPVVMSAAALLYFSPPALGSDCASLSQQAAAGGLADSALKEALENCPDSLDILSANAELKLRQQKYIEAKPLYQRLIRETPRNASIYAALGEVNEKLGESKEAVKNYRLFLSLNKNGGGKNAIYEKRMAELKEQMRSEKLVSSSNIVTALTQQTEQNNKTRGLGSIDVYIHFDTDSSRINKRSAAQLAEIANALQSADLKSNRILIEGHTDSAGSNEYNLQLSKERAKSVQNYLVNVFNIEGDRLDIEGMGEETPIASNETEHGRAQNRRVKILNMGLKTRGPAR